MRALVCALAIVLVASMNQAKASHEKMELLEHPAPSEEQDASSAMANLGKKSPEELIKIQVEILYKAKDKEGTKFGPYSVADLIEMNTISPPDCSPEALVGRVEMLQQIGNSPLAVYLYATQILAYKYCNMVGSEVVANNYNSYFLLSLKYRTYIEAVSLYGWLESQASEKMKELSKSGLLEKFHEAATKSMAERDARIQSRFHYKVPEVADAEIPPMDY